MKYYDHEKKAMDPPLTEKGIKQASELALRLSMIHFDKIYCSDLLRAEYTAEIVQSAVKTDRVVTEAFREIDMGSLYEMTWSKYPELFEKWKLHNEDISYPNGENGHDVWDRCNREINAIKLKNYDRIAIVSHGGTIRSIICGVLNIPQQVRFQFGHPPENCSISILRYVDDRFYLHSFNDASHISQF
jgi:broad specificity phosphatase PhoE